MKSMAGGTVNTMTDITMTDMKRPEDTITLNDDERQRCEVWTRVMGYHRPVASFNIGKKGEHGERRFFSEERIRPSL
jgi:anaerobic ribonucleoside-triphosphate reductase